MAVAAASASSWSTNLLNFLSFTLCSDNGHTVSHRRPTAQIWERKDGWRIVGR